MDIFPSVLVGMSMHHLKLSLVDTNSSVGMSRRDTAKPNKPTETVFTISVEIEQLLPHGNSSSPHAPPARYSVTSVHNISSELL